ncbi:MAG: LuxR family transcriptional regulator [Streptomyces sp.]|nr:LuxR family transcriptional regulator [Streptomyces sp.]NUS75037.1 LuxR family transcriptional regulator [Streptomyces sp.]
MVTQRSEGERWGWARSGYRHGRTGFIGRMEELAMVRAAVDNARVITLTGPGGVGKTRVALQAGQELQAGWFPDGVSVAELSGLRDAEFLPDTVASAVGVPEAAGLEPIDQLIAYFSDKRALLILDTCEHLVDAMAVFADILVGNTADLTLLLTSRQPVALAGEFVLPIGPMPLPDATSDETDNDTLKLFTARARAARPSFALSDDNRAEVLALCRRLEGIPLAIELAAARLRAMPLEQILERLDHRFEILAGARSAQARHQTLRAAIGWSHDLCGPAERELWARLSVFAGGFTQTAVEDVCHGGALDGCDIADLLVALVDRSVVQPLDGPGPQRYRMLDTIREFGAESLKESGDSETYARRHQEFFLRLAVQAGQEWFGDQQMAWGERLAADLDNFRLAMAFATAHPGDEAALRIVNGLAGLWLCKSRLTETRRWIDKALVAEPRPTPEHGLALWHGGYYGMVQFDPSSRELVRRCGEVAELLDDDFLRGRAAAAKAIELAAWGRNVPSAMAAYDHARALLRSNHDVFALVASYAQSAALLAGNGEVSRALAEVELGLRELAHIPHERWRRNRLLIMKVLCLWASGELDAARDLGRTVLRSALEQGETMSVAVTVEYLSWVACGKGEHELSTALLGGAGALWRQVGRLLWGEPGLNGLHKATENDLMHALGAEHFTHLYTYGTTLPVQDLTELAVGSARLPQARAPRAQDSSPLGPLTPREREVAHLIADHLSNREIAERLVISKRTADTHVEHILAKLGFTSRSQIAAVITETAKNSPYDEPISP